MYKTIALVMAAGTGSRAASVLPKQYMTLNGQSILWLAIEKLIKHEEINAISCVINKDHGHLYQSAIGDGFQEKLLPPIIGGNQRQDSVRLGLQALTSYGPQYVLIQDAARIFVESTQISQLIDALSTNEGAALGPRIQDTLWQERDGHLAAIPRDNVFQIQTPQAFRYEFISNLHQKYKDHNFTDDLGLAVHSGLQHKIKIIESSIKNFKITTPEDFDLARILHEHSTNRVRL